MIKIDNLAFSYGKNQVLNNISLTLGEGRIYGLLGENGVGKTTLLTLLCGLKAPQRGTILAEGEQPSHRSPAWLEQISYLPDDVAPVNDKALGWARSRGRFWPGFSLDKFVSVMREFETDTEQKLSTMSAGQLKKTYISFCLACNTKYLFMDEPTNGLDIPSKAQFRSAVLKYTDENATLVISTHQVRDLENVIDPIIILEPQDVLLNASVEEISSRLFFDYGSELHPESLYSEQFPGGFIQVYPNRDGRDSKVNIEALFNAAHRNREVIKSLFSK